MANRFRENDHLRSETLPRSDEVETGQGGDELPVDDLLNACRKTGVYRALDGVTVEKLTELLLRLTLDENNGDCLGQRQQQTPSSALTTVVTSLLWQQSMMARPLSTRLRTCCRIPRPTSRYDRTPVPSRTNPIQSSNITPRRRDASGSRRIGGGDRDAAAPIVHLSRRNAVMFCKKQMQSTDTVRDIAVTTSTNTKKMLADLRRAPNNSSTSMFVGVRRRSLSPVAFKDMIPCPMMTKLLRTSCRIPQPVEKRKDLTKRHKPSCPPRAKQIQRPAVDDDESCIVRCDEEMLSTPPDIRCTQREQANDWIMESTATQRIPCRKSLSREADRVREVVDRKQVPIDPYTAIHEERTNGAYKVNEEERLARNLPEPGIPTSPHCDEDTEEFSVTKLFRVPAEVVQRSDIESASSITVQQTNVDLVDDVGPEMASERPFSSYHTDNELLCFEMIAKDRQAGRFTESSNSQSRLAVPLDDAFFKFYPIAHSCPEPSQLIVAQRKHDDEKKMAHENVEEDEGHVTACCDLSWSLATVSQSMSVSNQRFDVEANQVYCQHAASLADGKPLHPDDDYAVLYARPSSNGTLWSMQEQLAMAAMTSYFDPCNFVRCFRCDGNQLSSIVGEKLNGSKVIVGQTNSTASAAAMLLVSPSAGRLIRHERLQLLAALRLVLEVDENEFIVLQSQ